MAGRWGARRRRDDRDAEAAQDPLHVPRVFRPVFVRVLSTVVWALMVVFLAMALRDGVTLALRSLPALALVSVLAYALFWRPAVEVDDDGVTLRNVLRDVRVPFAVLEAVDTRFALALETGGNRYTAWAAPAPGRTSSMSLLRSEATGVEHLGVDLSQGLRASAAPNTDSGGAAMLVQHRWERWRGSHPTSRYDMHTGTPTARVTWNVPVVVLLSLSLVATLVELVP